ncbi:MAG TPA: hypothetical protein PLD37_05975 [Usitatibacteraceae bacterium]|nr:hypothetical protein [Usitatibacteraceae bacterium]
MKRLLAAAGLVLGLGACGGDTYVKVQGTTTISKGQELQDLQRAFQEGAISQREYDDLRARILKRSH